MILYNNSWLLYNNSELGVIAQQINVTIISYIQPIVSAWQTDVSHNLVEKEVKQ
jgi:hypothetical protein